MYIHLSMAAVLGWLIYGSFVSASYISILHHGLTLVGTPEIQRHVHSSKMFSEHTRNASRDYATFTVLWVPLVLSAVGTVAWLWWSFAHDTELSSFQLLCAVLLISGALTVSNFHQLGQSWIHSWIGQLFNARNGVILDHLIARLAFIEDKLISAKNGTTTLTDDDAELLAAEVEAIHVAEVNIKKYQAEYRASINNKS
jgi:hypothetical protein